MNKSNIRVLLNKRGDSGEMIMMVARLAVIAIIAFTILGVSSIVYSYDINVRDVEARIMAKNIVNCLVDNSLFDVDSVVKNDEMLYSIISYCGYSGDLDRYYVRAEITQFEGEWLVLVQGDSGAKWVREMSESVTNYELYNPGYYRWSYDVNVEKGEGEGVGKNSKIVVEVLVNADV
jgi:hypothetical protein